MSTSAPECVGPEAASPTVSPASAELHVDPASAPSPAPEPALAAVSEPKPRTEVVRCFAGFRLTTLALIGVIAGLLAWNSWMTREVVALKRHRVVSVSLASIIADFVQTQAHQAGSPDEAAMRTRLYLAATQKALLELARNGTPVLASEAVLGNSVPDDTARVKQAVARTMAAQVGQH